MVTVGRMDLLMVSAHLVDHLVTQVEIPTVMVGMVEDGTDTVPIQVVVPHPTSEVRMDPLLMVDLVWQVMDKVVTTVEVAVEDTLAVALVVMEETVGEAVAVVHTSTHLPLTMLVAIAIRVVTVVKVT
tara:strand:+ start:108 stop:491 length:384 start_codon:yes stop_codon:yes gene_type:complete